ncbi:putative mitochondrial DNA-directed RNA polymerase [Aspergillus nomiae NRRL 13137]|uniref:DNA-directed RNA polymerase n=1 Tax=Aspergillus nomiae NRRL (strain ATCC 15546 / NRRL 13137 / CBS 260.88 / M93) TaxID=1509407 RepID=A0A0L1J817_ASPN3|nr:putative mitochondrial DNA-directed RNA polymerase [Aspergillus nomiae NRRL 13137]KNG87835.1 putative mitochondrial DNA-directed RNA polymerase [Aspergillus nomiae NRRL 13137]
MLSRVARQKNAASHLRVSNGRLVSPSLATLRFHSHLGRPNSYVNASVKVSPNRSRQPYLQPYRHLATAADHSAVEQTPYPSFENSSYTAGHRYDQPAQMTSLFPPISKGFNASSLIIIDDLLQTRPRALKKHKGIGGDEDEMMANLDISLKVGRMDRAANLITRLGEYFPIGSPEYLAIHNRYLEEMVSHMVVTRQHNLVLPLQRWFEVDMAHGGVQPDARTYAIMIRMALRMLHGAKRDRAVRRYWSFAKTAGVEEEVLAVPVLSELELGELSEICSSDLRRVAIGSMHSDITNTNSESITDEIPAVRPVDQKGLGLSSLQDSLSMFSTGSDVAFPTDTKYTEEEKLELYNQLRQRQLETDSIRTSLERWRQEFTQMQKSGLDMTGGGKKLGTIMNQWHMGLVSRIQEELKLVDEAEANPIRTFEQKERYDYGVYLRSLDPERLAALTILAVISTFSRGGMERGIKVSAIATGIGKDLQDELIAEITLKKQQSGNDARRMKALREILAGRKQKDGRAPWQKIVHDLEKEDPAAIWPPRVKAKIGAVLMSFLFDVGKVPVAAEHPGTKKKTTTLQPAFQHSYQINWGRKSGYVHLHPEIVQIVAREPTADVLGRQLPMICKPRPWNGPKDGGYFIYQSNIVRATPGETLQPSYIKAAMENNGLEQVREGLNILGRTGWRINRDVFEVMLEAWNSGEAVASLAPLNPDLPHPPKPAPEEGFAAEKKWDNAMREIENRRSGMHSNRCFQNFQLEVARAYRNDTFYLPHNMDFRGRAYPLPPYLNQMGADNARGLLLFSEAKPLGARGLTWLKIQIANLSGFDKASLSEREQWTMDHLDDVLDSANKGLHGRRWWLDAEDPWQCLAACCELRNALQHPDPTQYPSRLPIHQDGSCNGLQHYAALGGDKVGAQQVNLEPSDRPSDVYSGVAQFVKEAVAREAKEGTPIAKLLDGKITRKIVKQTVMTNVYGVTFMGAMKQVRKQLVDHYPELSADETKSGSLYIARKIFEALGTMFNGAHEIQYWLGDCASRITQSLAPEQIEEIAKEALSPTQSAEGSTKKAGDPAQKFRSTVIWTTPLGLPVVQPYRVRKSRRVRTTIQDLSIVDMGSDDVVSKRKQLQAFPPNFIHSLDATHMMLSAIACDRAGLSFSAVHDSFWTHACDVDSMNNILREAFVRMHSDDVVKRLAAEFEVRYGKNLFLAKVNISSKIGKAIRAHRRHANNKSAKVQELLEEYKRQKLLQSDDPELQAQGRAMVTPASIFEQAGGADKDLSISSSLGETVVGHVPENLEAAERKTSGMETDTSDPVIESLMTDFDDVLGPKANLEDAAAEADLDEIDEPKKKRRGAIHTWLWLPLRFREVPQKGEWDITRIRDSEYFFS